MDLRIQHFRQALESLDYLTTVDTQALAQILDERLLDGIENGKAQKFEVVTELCWKSIKDHLRTAKGLDVASPKQAIKAFYRSGRIDEGAYLTLMAAIDTRNRLSPIYDEAKFRAALSRSPEFVAAFKACVDRAARAEQCQRLAARRRIA